MNNYSWSLDDLAKKQVESVVTGVADMAMQNAEDAVYKSVKKYLNRR